MIKNLEDIDSLKDLPEEIQVCCPFCPPHYQDGKTKLNINFNKNVYHCWRCNASGRAVNLLKKYANINQNELFDYMFDPDNMQFTSKNNIKSTDIPDIFDYDNISNKIIDNDLYNAKEYLNNRGISDIAIKYYDIRVGRSNTLFKHRVIVPTYDNYGNVVYFVARLYCKTDDPRKYLNSPGSNKSEHVWNLNHAKENDTIIICEGCFSGISADRIENMTAVCTYGKFISNKQAKLIAEKHPKEIIMSLDGDVPYEELVNNINILKNYYYGKISYISIPDKKDPNDLLLEEYIDLINNRKEFYK